MTELSKFIGELVEYREKVESHLNKKYKPFVRKIINWDSLGKSVNPNKIKLTKELIVFKLGLEAKSVKAIEISLFYLLVSLFLSRKCLKTNLSTSTSPIIVSVLPFHKGELMK